MKALRNIGLWLDGLARRTYEVPATSERLVAMEGLRAYAALLVFMVHYFGAYGGRVLHVDFDNFRLGRSNDVWINGCYYLFASHYGVDIFFLLSGFLIARLVRRPGFKYGSFLWHRVRRIYPAFLVSLVMWAYLRVEVQGWYPFDRLQFFGNLLFLNAIPQLQVKPYAMITWSLCYEFIFYLTFPVLMQVVRRSRRYSMPLLILCSGLLVGALLQLGDSFIRFLMFFGGVLLAYIPEQRLISMANKLPEGLVIIGYLASTLWFAYILDYLYFIPVFVPIAAALTLKALYGSGWLNRAFSWRPLRYLGNISYSFYLLHAVGIEFVMEGYPQFLKGLTGFLYLIVTMGVALAIALAFATAVFLVAEKPYFKKGLAKANLTKAEPVLT